MNEAFCRFNKSIQDHHSRCSTVSDFKAEILHDTAPAARLNVVLCEIAEGNFRQAMLLAEKELENEPYGLFNTVTDGGIKSIYDYVSPAKSKNYMLYCNGNFIGGLFDEELCFVYADSVSELLGAAGTRLPWLLQYRPAQDAGDPGGTLGKGTETALCREI